MAHRSALVTAHQLSVYCTQEKVFALQFHSVGTITCGSYFIDNIGGLHEDRDTHTHNTAHNTAMNYKNRTSLRFLNVLMVRFGSEG